MHVAAALIDKHGRVIETRHTRDLRAASELSERTYRHAVAWLVEAGVLVRDGHVIRVDIPTHWVFSIAAAEVSA